MTEPHAELKLMYALLMIVMALSPTWSHELKLALTAKKFIQGYLEFT